MAETKLIVVRNPFDRSEKDQFTVTVENASVNDLALMFHCEKGFSAAIDGQLVTREEWEQRVIRSGEFLTFVPVLSGGDSGSLLGTVAMLAVAVAAPYVAGYAMGSAWGTSALTLGGWGMAATVGIQLAGGYLVNSLLPPPRLKANHLDSFDSSPTYSWGATNTSTPGVPIARQYGKIRRKGNVIASYTDSTGENGTQQTRHILIDLGMGPVHSISDVLINGQPASSYSGVTIENRLGLLDQTAIEEFNDTKVEVPLSQKISLGSPVTNVAGSGIDKVEAEVTFTGGLWKANNSGGLSKHTVTLRFEINDGGGYVQIGSDLDVTAATTQPVRRTFVATGLDKSKTYTIRISNLTADQTSIKYGDDVYLTTVRKIVFDDFEYPRTALLAVRALATDQLSGGLDVSCLVEGLECNVWNGSAWAKAYTRNPAWAAFDALTQPVWDGSAVVEYEGINPSNLILSEFYELAQFCDEIVGGEVRYRVDGVQDTESNVFDVSNEILGTARACLIPRGTKLGVHFDRAVSTPTQLFTVGNTKVNGFREIFLPTAERIVRLECDYLNEEADYQRDVLTVIDSENDIPGASVSNISAKWMTRPAQIWRDAKYRLNRNKHLHRTAEIDVDIDAIACRVGDLVYVQSDVAQWGVGGRLVSGTVSQLTLDREVTMQTGKTYQVMVRFSDDTLATRSVVLSVGTTSVINLSSPLPETPIGFEVFSFGETNLYAKPFIVTNISRASDQSATLGMIEYNESVYDDSGEALPTLNYSRASPVLISGLTIKDKLRTLTSGLSVTDVQVNFSFTDENQIVDSVSVQKQSDQGSFVDVYSGRVTSRFVSVTIEDVQTNDSISFRVVLKDIAGAVLATESIGHTPDEKTVVSGSVTAISATPGYLCVDLSFSTADMLNSEAVEIHESATNDRTAAVLIASLRHPTKNHKRTNLAVGETRYYWARVVDENLNESAWHPVSSTGGIVGTTSTDPNFILDQISGALSEDELASGLAARIDLIDTSGPYDIANGLASSFRQLVGQSKKQIVDAEKAGEGILSNLLNIEKTKTAYALADFQLDTQITEGLAAEASARLLLEAEVDSNTAAILSEQTARADGDSALATDITTLQVTLEGDIASVQSYAEAVSSDVTGIGAKWGVKVQTVTDGTTAVSGIELNNGTDGETTFAVLADKFLVYRPDGTGTPVQMLSLGTVGGVTALGLNGNLLVDGSIIAGKIAAGSVTADKFSTTYQHGSLYMGAADGYILAQADSDLQQLTIYQKATSTSTKGIQVTINKSSSVGIWGWTVGGAGIGVKGQANGAGIGVLGQGVQSGGKGVQGEGASYDFYANGAGANYGPFTGSHDALLERGEFPVNGDILVDVDVVAKRNVSNVITSVIASSEPMQNGVIGVQCRRNGLIDWDNPPSALVDYCGDKDYIYERYSLICINSVGEGLINVCGENGDLKIGDLIVTSSMPGKGMKQDDDVVRSVTVAKCRESATFDYPGQVKQVACIYLCG